MYDFALCRVFKGLRSTLSSHKSVSKAVRIASGTSWTCHRRFTWSSCSISYVTDVILWMFIFIVALIIFNIPLAEVFVPFSATLVAISFAIGSDGAKLACIAAGGRRVEAF